MVTSEDLNKRKKAIDLIAKAKQQEKEGTFSENERAAFTKAKPLFKKLGEKTNNVSISDTKSNKGLQLKDSEVDSSRDIFDDTGKKTGQRSQAAMDYLNKGLDTKDTGVVETGPTDVLSKAQEGVKTQQKGIQEQQEIQAVSDQAEYLQKSKEQQEYEQDQEDRRKKIESISEDITERQSSERIIQAKSQLKNLKANLAYLGTMGRPGVSSVKLDAVDKQITDGERVFNDLVKTESQLKQARELGQEGNAKAFERRMETLQNDLDSKVNDVIQDALNNLNSEEIKGEIDTVEEINELRLNILDSIDRSVEGITNKNIQQRQALLEEYQKVVEDQKIYIANKNIVNKDMSAISTYYVDGNNNPIISATTGTSIPIPETSPMDPVYDRENGRLITFSTDENGGIVANVDQIIDTPSFEQTTISNYANLLASGKINMNDVPQGIRNTTSFAEALSQAEWKTEQDTITADWTKLNDGTLYNRITGETKDVGQVKGTGTDQDLTQQINEIKTDNNVGKWTNNPGNIMGDTQAQKDYAMSLGAIGFYNSSNGRVYAVFPDMTIGNQALISDLETKLSGGSSWATANTNLIDFATGWTRGPNAEQRNINAAYNMTEYLRGQGIQVDDTTKIQDIPVDKLAEAVRYNEGTLGQQGQQYSSTINKEQMIGDPTKPLGDLGDYWKNILVARLGKQIYGTRISDKEGERVESFITGGSKIGKSQYDIIDDVLGYNVTKNKEVGNLIKDILIENAGGEGLAGFDMAGMARLLNSNNPGDAIAKMEKSIFKKSGDKEAEAREKASNYAINKGDAIIEKITNNLDKLGIVQGKYEDLKSKFIESPEYVDIKGDLAGLVAQWRNEMLGSNVTELEKTFLDGIIADTQDNPFNAITKIKNFQTMNVDQANSIRSFYGLPNLDRDTIVDKEKRVGLYTGQPETNNQPLEDDDIYNDIFGDGTGGLQDLSGF